MEKYVFSAQRYQTAVYKFHYFLLDKGRWNVVHKNLRTLYIIFENIGYNNYENIRYNFENIGYNYENIGHNLEEIGYNFENIRYNHENIGYNPKKT